jgi:oxaloacetate decarboxylase beta subunit
MIQELLNFFQETGVSLITWQMVVMWAVCLLLFYLAVYKGFEPLLLVPIAFGALLANLPTRGVITQIEQPSGIIDTGFVNMSLSQTPPGDSAVPAPADQIHVRVDKVEGGLFDFISQGIKLEIFPPLIFLGVGALTDFGPLIANPRTLMLGAAAQFGILFTFFGATMLGFSANQAASIGIIGGADGPTSVFVTNKLAPELLGPVAVAAYTYMALVPLIQPPIMRMLTTEKERKIRMKSLRQVGRLERLSFCVLVTFTCIILVPDAAALIGMLMLGNFLRESGVTERLVKSAQNEIINIVTIFLGVSVGITMQGERFLQFETMKIILLGIVAFSIATGSGVLVAKLINLFSKGNPINPLIGSAGVSAVPMAARVSHLEGQRADPNNYLLMHAMGPNVAGVIGTAIAAGYFISALSR